MSDRKTKKDKKQHSKKEKKRTKEIPMLNLDNGDKVPAKNTYMENTELCKIDEIDIGKIRVSDKYSYKKPHESYKHYVFYEHNSEYISLRIILRDMVGYCSEYENPAITNKKNEF